MMSGTKTVPDLLGYFLNLRAQTLLVVLSTIVSYLAFAVLVLSLRLIISGYLLPAEFSAV